MSPLRQLSHRGLLILPLLVWTLVSGCARLNLPQKIFAKQEPQPVTPERILPMWTDTVLYQAGKVGVRGFGARIYFYGENEEPIQVDGGLTVYAFDAERPDGRMPAPEKKFVFSPEQFKTHYSKTNLGHSYSVWLPWDEVGGPARHISLVARFESSDGGVLVSDPIRKQLPGSVDVASQPASETDPRGQDGGVQHASYESKTTPEAITIQVPPSFANKLKGDSAETITPGPDRATPAAEPVPVEATRKATSEPALEKDEAEPAGSYRRRLSDHFERTRLRVREDTTSRPGGAVPRRQPLRAEWRSGLPLTPRSAAQ